MCRLVVEEQEGAGIGGTRVGEGVVGCQLPIDALGPELESRSGVDPSNPIGFDDDGKPVRTLPEGVSAGSVVAGLLPAGADYVRRSGRSALRRSPPRPIALLGASSSFRATDNEVGGPGPSAGSRPVPGRRRPHHRRQRGGWRWSPAEGAGQLYAINVDPDHWGTGAGKALLAAAQAELVRLSYTEAVLWVLPGNARARRFYEVAGWADDGTQRTGEAWGIVFTEVRYRRRLRGPPGRT